MSAVIASAVDDMDFKDDDWPTVPCFMVNSAQINLILEYCEHFGYEKDFDNIQIPIPKGDKAQWITDEWELNFINALSLEDLCELLLACNYLNVPALFELCCATVASIFKGQNFNKMKKDIIINSDPKSEKYTEQDDEELQRKYPWIL